MGDYDPNRNYGGNGYDPYRNYYSPGGKPKKKHTGLLVVLVILALLTGAASWAVNVLGLRVDIGEKGAVVTIGEKGEASAEMAEQPTPEQAAQPETDPQPEVPEHMMAAPDAASALELQQSPESVENRPAEEENALSL